MAAGLERVSDPTTASKLDNQETWAVVVRDSEVKND